MAFEFELRWRALDGDGLEHVNVIEDAAGVHVRSVAIGTSGDRRYGVAWRAELSPEWTFRALAVERTDGARLDLAADAGRWSVNGRHSPQLDGCIDIDISGTPFTNTLPIRRVTFEPGVPRRFDMAWVPIDTLVPLKDGQIYTRLDQTRFRYEAADGTFAQVLSVDEHGFVLDYPTLFRRV